VCGHGDGVPLAQKVKQNMPMTLELLDAYPLGSGATGVAAGLLHPLAPSGKPLWQGMTSFAKASALVHEVSTTTLNGTAAARDPFWRKTGLFRPASTDKQRRQFEKKHRLGTAGRCA